MRAILAGSRIMIAAGIVLFAATLGLCQTDASTEYGQWMAKPQSEWPQIAMINQIEYTDVNYPIAGCGFLLDTGDEILAATAKHILMFFKSDTMESVDLRNSLKRWKMFPKNNPDDVIVLDELINVNPEESLDSIPSERDWLLFTVGERCQNIQPLRFRAEPMEAGEEVYVIGWRYSDKNCPQVVYEGNFAREETGSLLITTKELSDNTMPGLSGSPVIDSRGYLIGLMSQKAGEMERLSSVDYPRTIVARKTNSSRAGAPITKP